MSAVVSQRTLAAGLLVVAALWPRLASASHTAVEWRVAEGGNGHLYEVVAAGPYNYDGARAVAARSTRDGVPGYLATITSAEEQAFVLSLVPATSRQYFFIGGVQDPAGGEPDGGWSWVTGEPWSYTNWSADPAEPNNYGGTEHYLTLQSPAGGGETAIPRMLTTPPASQLGFDKRGHFDPEDLQAVDPRVIDRNVRQVQGVERGILKVHVLKDRASQVHVPEERAGHSRVLEDGAVAERAADPARVVDATRQQHADDLLVTQRHRRLEDGAPVGVGRFQ
jgi:hypothetical protein